MTAGPDDRVAIRRLRKRAEFVRAARGKRTGRAAFSLQAIEREADTAGLGFTVTKRVGNAPERNRIRRRLRAAAEACAAHFQPRHDYVLIGRREALSLPFDELVTALAGAITRIHASPAPSRSRNER